MKTVSSCGHELTTRLLDQKSECALDSCFNRMLSTLTQEIQACALFFSKHFSQIHTPVVVFNSLDEPLCDDAIDLYLAKLKNSNPVLKCAKQYRRNKVKYFNDLDIKPLELNQSDIELF
ncbi:hypothetical protein [Pseudoalteromonas aurantia]|uniref:Uncharacterized protein n=1 Tax=Pseudoalteromonas aurantia TaxID=43654 RepID=A0A5S3VD29_9GAMM|nr:hypothetical protein [Pseudoalteromonas aurantia]TMO60603.1 hypothetical protein CWC18_13135 [Pseudoalteromonas aurantia]TMO70102.1 hypothetical protein CWC19_02650 [Pseudoalteromonas aurantia]TMO76128.1 hypothetical protein CWC20_06410 [Pseudoalteromonas aurantia]